MARLFRNNPETPEGKYLVKRRDGTIPEWPFLVLGAADPCAPAAIRAYAAAVAQFGMDQRYVADLYELATDFERWMAANKQGDPDAPRHRKDDPATVAEMTRGKGA